MVHFQGGLSQEISRKKEDLDSVKAEAVEKFEKFRAKSESEYSALKDTIERLLPGATSAGLASSFSTSKVSFKNRILVYTVVYYCAVILLCLFGVWITYDYIGAGAVSLIKTASPIQLINSLIYKLPVFIPLIWIATFSAKRRSEYSRLEQEYEHKWALTSSYLGFKSQLDKIQNDDRELVELLLRNAIEAISFNPSRTLDGKHEEKIPIVEKVEQYISQNNDKGSLDKKTEESKNS